MHNVAEIGDLLFFFERVKHVGIAFCAGDELRDQRREKGEIVLKRRAVAAKQRCDLFAQNALGFVAHQRQPVDHRIAAVFLRRGRPTHWHIAFGGGFGAVPVAVCQRVRHTLQLLQIGGKHVVKQLFQHRVTLHA